MKVGGQRHVPAALPPGKSRYPLYRRLGGPQGRSGRVRKICLPPGFDPRTLHPVANRYTDWAVPAHSHHNNMYYIPLKYMAVWIGKNFEIPWRWRQTFVPKRCNLYIKRHSVVSQKMEIFMNTVWRNLHLAQQPFGIYSIFKYSFVISDNRLQF
jgi:hypothetical protein